MIWDTKKVLAAGALVIGLTQIGNGLKAASYLIGVPETAYAAKAKAEEVDDHFQQYLAKQQAYTEALNQVIQQQQQTPNQAGPVLSPTPSWWWAQDPDGAWYCTDGNQSWWPNEEDQCD